MNYNELSLKIGENLKYYRLNNLKYGYLTQEQLARISKVNITLIRGVESHYHHHSITLEALFNIAKSLDIPIFKFFV